MPKVTPPPKGLRQEAVPVSGHTVRARGEKFAEHTDQATLFYNSLTDVEKYAGFLRWRSELTMSQDADGRHLDVRIRQMY